MTVEFEPREMTTERRSAQNRVRRLLDFEIRQRFVHSNLKQSVIAKMG